VPHDFSLQTSDVGQTELVDEVLKIGGLLELL
jgi:hypothetical protein